MSDVDMTGDYLIRPGLERDKMQIEAAGFFTLTEAMDFALKIIASVQERGKVEVATKVRHDGKVEVTAKVRQR